MAIVPPMSNATRVQTRLMAFPPLVSSEISSSHSCGDGGRARASRPVPNQAPAASPTAHPATDRCWVTVVVIGVSLVWATKGAAEAGQDQSGQRELRVMRVRHGSASADMGGG